MIHIKQTGNAIRYQRGNPFEPTKECSDCAYNLVRWQIERGYAELEWVSRCPSCRAEQVPF